MSCSLLLSSPSAFFALCLAAPAGRVGAAGAVRVLHRNRLRGHMGGSPRVDRHAREAAGGRQAYPGVAPPAYVDHADISPLHSLLFWVSCSVAGSRDMVWIVDLVSF
jgi:hypothetical protein